MSTNKSYYEQHYNIPSGLPRLAKDILIAIIMFYDKGPREALLNIYKRILTRLHFTFIDKRKNDYLPSNALSNERLEGMKLTDSAKQQDLAEIFYAPNPSLTLKWALNGLGLDWSRFSFLDCGSGLGYAMFTAAAYPFQKIHGVEFAKELFERSRLNLEAIASHHDTRCADISVEHQNILEYSLEKQPLVIFMSNPFKADVMEPWAERIAESFREQPREMYIVYANPTWRGIFDRHPNFAEVPFSTLRRLLFWLCSPFNVVIYKVTK